MSEENNHGVSIINGLVDVVKKRLHTDNVSEIQQVTDLILTSVISHLDAGDQLAYLKRLENGTLGLTTLGIDWGDEE